MENLPIESYTTEQTEIIKTITLSVATILGSYLDDLVIVGGLVPSLLIPTSDLPAETERHAGTMDLDLGLDITIFDSKRYADISDCLRANGFVQDENEKGNPVRQRWRFSEIQRATIDFLIQQTDENEKPGGIKSLEPDFAAFIIPGMELAFTDSIPVTITGTNLWHEEATRTIQVCNPGVFVLLKALANRNRRKPKDAYDLFYMIRNYGTGVGDVARYLKPLAATAIGSEALAFLREDFLDENKSGPVRVAEFLNVGDDSDLRADVVGFVADLLRAIEQ